MHSSIFSYSITRPYPFRWFTPVVIIGGFILTAIFTLLNLSSSVYYTKAIYTTNPNATIEKLNARWFRRAPFNWQGDAKAECQPALLSVGSSISTANLGFRYQITGIRPVPGNDQPSSSLPGSMRYMNSLLQNCQVQEIFISLKKVDPSKPPSSTWNSWEDSSVTSTLWCIVLSDEGAKNVTMKASNNNAQRNFNYVLVDDPKTHASVWWGTRLLNAYLNGVLTTASQTRLPDDSVAVARGGMRYMPNPSNDDIRSDDFFYARWFWNLEDGLNKNNDGRIHDPGYNMKNSYWSPALTEGLHVAKLLHSLFAQDLGSCSSPNLLLDEDSLKFAILSPNNMNRKPGGLLNSTGPDRLDGFFFNQIPTPGRTLGNPGEGLTSLKNSFERFKPLMGSLSCKETTLVAEYLCSVPEKKSIGVLLCSLVLANLVFLQAAWKLLQWTAGSLVTKRDSSAMICEGCVYLRSLENSEQKVGEDAVDDETGEIGNGCRRSADA
ncbi:hypothetical protein RB213_015246 [Colletotrichum asianum]